jgi:hypothetical protein
LLKNFFEQSSKPKKKTITKYNKKRKYNIHNKTISKYNKERKYSIRNKTLSPISILLKHLNKYTHINKYSSYSNKHGQISMSESLLKKLNQNDIDGNSPNFKLYKKWKNQEAVYEANNSKENFNINTKKRKINNMFENEHPSLKLLMDDNMFEDIANNNKKGEELYYNSTNNFKFADNINYLKFISIN